MTNHEDKRSSSDPTVTGTPAMRGVGASPAPQQIGPYKLVRTLGQGGMGVVYLAEQAKPVKRSVALKVIKPGMDSKAVIARFEAERQALALMNHPGVAKVFDAGTTPEGRPYFVMELVTGVPITEHCDEKKLGIKERLELFVDVCDAVQHAHQKGIIHRDIKPSNILVEHADGKTTPKVIDFGIAKATEQSLTQATMFTETGHFVGTPAYMSPEQARMVAGDIDTRSDIYSMGVVLYQLLAGALPFDTKSLIQAGFDEVRRVIMEDEPPKPSTRLGSIEPKDDATKVAGNRSTSLDSLARRIRGDLDWITMKALEKDRARRYVSASDLAEDILRHIHHEPVVAGPPSKVYRMRKFVRRNRGLVTAVVGVTAALVAGSVGTTWQALEATRQRDLARREAETARQVQSVLIDLFKVSDPSEARGNTITAREIMDRGAERIGRELGDRPLVQAALLNTISEVYVALGLYDRALPLARQALSIQRQERGDEHPEIAASLTAMAHVYYSQGNYEAAERLFREALAMRRKLLPENHPDLLVSLNNLATLLQDLGQYAEAEQLLRAVVVQRSKLLGANTLIVADSFNGLGNVVGNQGRFAEAERLHREALALYRAQLGDDHPVVAKVLNNLAVALSDLGNYADAEAVNRKALTVRRKLFGDEHREVADSLHNLAVALANQGEYTEAERLDRDALDLYRKLLGDDHPVVAMNLGSLLIILKAQGKTEQSRPLVAELLAHCRNRTKRPDATADDFNALAWHLLTIEPVDLRDPSAALAAARIAVEKTGRTDPAYLDTLALAQKKTGNVDAAVKTQRAAVALLRHAPSPLRAEFETNLAGYLVEQGSYAEAEPLLLGLYDQLSGKSESFAEQEAEMIRRIIELYESWHAAEPEKDYGAKAAKWRAELSARESVTDVPGGSPE